jgi:chromate transporter
LPTLESAIPVWGRIAALSFGGPAGQIAVMHRILVDEQRWIGEARFLHALNYCMLLPGPEAQQLATYIGWLMHGIRGGLLAGLLFILPGFVAILALSILYVTLGEVALVRGLFFGLQAAVLAIVAQALVRIGGRTLRHPAAIGLALAAFLALFVFGAPFPVVILAAAAIGLGAARAGSAAFATAGHGGARAGLADRDSLLGETLPAHARRGQRATARVSFVLAALWLVPVGLLLLLLPGSVFTDLATFFSQMAVLTFGGAYAVLAWVADVAVEGYGWLTPAEMLDGLAMAETTPGPLIMVTQFVGFLAAFRNAGGLDPMLAAVLGSVLVTWVTFIPCFLWIFLGAPHAEALRHNRALAGALGAISAAVVGVIANLALWFALHVLFAEHRTVPGLALEWPIAASLDPWAALLAVLAMSAAFAFKVGPMRLLAAAGLAGIALALAGQV